MGNAAGSAMDPEPRHPRERPPSGVRGMAHTSLISLDVADTLSDTLVRGHTQCPADGIAVPMPCLKTTRPSTDTLELTADELKNRSANHP